MVVMESPILLLIITTPIPIPNPNPKDIWKADYLVPLAIVALDSTTGWEPLNGFLNRYGTLTLTLTLPLTLTPNLNPYPYLNLNPNPNLNLKLDLDHPKAHWYRKTPAPSLSSLCHLTCTQENMVNYIIE